jgi:hypothetical protein
MRIAQSVFVGSIAVLAALASPLASPASANSSNVNSHANANAKVEDEPASSGCRAYQKGPDGSWVELACHEGAGSAPAPVHSKSASHTSGETAR